MMKDLNLGKIQDIPPYAGEHAVDGIRFRAVRELMGVSSFGINVMELDPHCEGYPEHDHHKDGQEELYLILQGRVQLRVDDEIHELEQGSMVRVGPALRRQFITQNHGVTILALGATPGQAYGTPQPSL